MIAASRQLLRPIQAATAWSRPSVAHWHGPGVTDGAGACLPLDTEAEASRNERKFPRVTFLHDPGDHPIVVVQNDKPGPNPRWASKFPRLGPNALLGVQSLFNQDGSVDSSNQNSDAGVAFPDGSGGRA